MLNNNKNHWKTKIHSIIVLFIIIGSGLLIAQEFQGNDQQLSRGKWWSFHNEVYTNPNSFQGGYPGYYSPQRGVNMIGWNSFERMYAIVRDTVRFALGPPGMVEQVHTLVKNYNFSKSATEAEEYSYWTSLSTDDETVASATPGNMAPGAGAITVKVHWKDMVWSLPEFDDIIIQHQVWENIGTDSILDFRYGFGYSISMGLGAVGNSFDKEYEWHTDIQNRRGSGQEGGFLWFDENSRVPGSAEATYTVSPGDVTGDNGNPGNIRDAKSLDRRLYTPQHFIDDYIYVTPNKHGVSAVNHWIGTRILNENSGAPNEEFFQPNITDPSYSLERMSSPQTKASWNANHADASTIDGTEWERQPSLILSWGPYDLGPGDKVEVVRLLAAGEMDRNISEKGGTVATQAYHTDGTAAAKANWAAGLKLYDGWVASGKTNWNAGITSYPPPTPGNAPKLNDPNEILVAPYIDVATGTQGYDITFDAVPDSYTDPIKGTNDHSGYRVYKSEARIEGPWDKIADISKADAAAMTAGGKVKFRYATDYGIPSRFWVTSYDSDGNESGFTAYSWEAISAKPVPSNDLDGIVVIPNPFRQQSGLADPTQYKRISFLNVPAKCTIRLYTIAGEELYVINHDSGFGETTWGDQVKGDYMLTKFMTNVQPGVYVFHVESHVSGHEGESRIGKIAIIK